MSNSNSRIARNTILLTIRMLIVLIISLYTTRIILSSLGVVDYGVYNVVCGFVSMFAFLNTSMTNGIQRFYNYEIGHTGGININSVFNTAILIQALLALFLIILTETFGLWYMNNKMVVPLERVGAAHAVFHLSLLSFLFIVLQSPFSALVMAHERMDYFAIVSVFDAVLKLLIAFVLPFLGGDSLVIYGYLLTGISIINFVLFFFYDHLRFKSEIRIRRAFSAALFKEMLSFSGWNIFGSFSNMMKEQGINLVLNFFCGPIVNAARGIASQVNGGLQSLVANLSVAVRPQVVQSYASGDIERTLKLTFSISKISITVLYLIALPIVLEIDYILLIWLGNNSIPEHTTTFIKIVIFTSFVNVLNSAVSGVVHASGKMRTYQVVTSLISILCIPMAFLLMKMGFPPESTLWSVLVFTTLAQIASLYILKGIIDYSIINYCRRVLMPFIFLVVATAWAAYIPHFKMEMGFVRLFLVFLIAFITIIPVSYFGVLDRDERQLLNSLFYKRFKTK